MVLGHENMTLSVLLLLITAYAFLMLEEMWVRAWFPKGEGFPEDNSAIIPPGAAITACLV